MNFSVEILLNFCMISTPSLSVSLVRRIFEFECFIGGQDGGCLELFCLGIVHKLGNEGFLIDNFGGLVLAIPSVF